MSLSALLDSVPFTLDDADRAARFPIPSKNFRVQYPNGDIKQFDGAVWNLLMSGGKAPAGGRTITDLTTYILNNAVLNVKDFAAPGVDISTNVNEAGNALNAAIVAANAYGLAGAGVYMPPGDYKISVLIVGRSNVRIFGDPTATTIHWNRGAASGFIAQLKTNIVIEGIRTVGTCAINWQFDQCTKIYFRRNTVTGGTVPDAATGYSGGFFATLSDDVTIEESRFEGSGNNTPGFLSSDIQINGNGVTVLGNERIHILNNRCTSTLVQVNIACYDMQKSIIAGNFVSGAKAVAALTSAGYGIMIYKTTVSGPGACHDNNVHHNTVWSVEGSGIYIQTGLRTVCNCNIIYDSGIAEDDTALAVGGISYSTCSEGVITGNIILLSGKAGIVIAGLSATDGFTISANVVDGCATRIGIWIRCPLQRSSITCNMVTNCYGGIGTITGVDIGVVGLVVNSNSVQTTLTLSPAIVFQGITNSEINGNVVQGSGGDSIAVVNGDRVGVQNNCVVNGSAGNNNTYSGILATNVTRANIVGNVGGNTGGTGFAYGVRLTGTCTKSSVLANNFDGCLTTNFPAVPAGQSILWAGNQDGAVNPGIWQTVQSIVLTGGATSITQILLGSSSSVGAIGTRWSGGELTLASNAQQNLGADSWHQSLGAAASKLIRLNQGGDIEFYHKAAGAADGNLATFWGTPTHSFAANGDYKINGTKVLGARDAGWTAMTGAAGDKATAYDPATITLPQLGSRVKAIQNVMTAVHGMIGP